MSGTDLPPLDAEGLLRELPALAADDVGSLVGLVRSQLAPGTGVSIWLADYQEAVLTELGADGRSAAGLPVRGTAAGLAFTRQQPAWAGDRLVAWVPLTNRWRRLGVLQLTSSGPDGLSDRTVARGLALAGLLAAVLDHASRCTDVFHRAKRNRPLSLTAEMQWDLLPPPSIAGIGVSLTGRLEPSYEVGGDAFDYAINGTTAHLAVFDPVGHDLRAALLAALAVGTYRNARRCGVRLEQTGGLIDAALAAQFPRECFVTGQLCELDLTSGELRWTNAGHPLPVLVRDGQAQSPAVGPDRPWGLGHTASSVGTVHLQPGDRLVLVTDGVLEARTADGASFGLDRLIELLVRRPEPELSPAELLRRLLDAVMTHRGGPLHDDATAVLLEWRGPGSAAPLGG